MKRLLLISAAVAGVMSTVQGCAGGGGASGQPAVTAAEAYRAFPTPKAPSSMMDEQSMAEYLAEHYWDAYFAGDGANDGTAVLGVRREDLEQAMANWIRLLDSCPLAEAQKCIGGLFDSVVSAQTADSTTHAYVIFREMVEKYMYDPNSPLRDEDYFLPYVSALAASPLTDDDLRPSYEFQARMCSLNRAGTVAPDFNFRTPDGRKRNLHGVRAYATVLFFSNPGCTACKEIVEALETIPDVENLVSSGRLAIVNIYIDEELDKWREYLPNYPPYWICGYDYRYIIRKDLLYNVRAIPSLYLLDAEKRVLCKDAPTGKLIMKLNSLLCQ